jgi:hypothetical protein
MSAGLDRLMRFFWLRVPLRAARLWPSAGMALADGHYLTRWPAAALTAGPLLSLLGLGAGALHRGPVFTSGLLLMVLFGVVGQAGASLGLWATAGYAVGDLVLRGGPLDDRPGGLLTGVVPHLLSYVLLGLLTVVLPLAVLGARVAVTGVRRVPRRLIPWLAPIGGVLVAALGAGLWAMTVPVLVRPVFAWPRVTNPGSPLGRYGWILVAAVALAAVARVLAERRALTGRVAALSMILAAGLRGQRARTRPAALALVAVGLGSAGTTWLLSGLINNYLEALIVLLFFAALFFVRFFVVTVGAPAAGPLAVVPLPLRVLAGLVLSYLAARGLIAVFWTSTRGYLPMLTSVCVAVAMMVLLTLPYRASTR